MIKPFASSFPKISCTTKERPAVFIITALNQRNPQYIAAPSSCIAVLGVTPQGYSGEPGEHRNVAPCKASKAKPHPSERQSNDLFPPRRDDIVTLALKPKAFTQSNGCRRTPFQILEIAQPHP
ncbi:hypothetical protein NL676_026688 [Syzygium grande]|nr:hypothetical protein NL676_026688 [Syzygium grande]